MALPSPDVREFSEARLRFRDDLQVTVDREAAPPFSIVEDPLTSRFYRLGQTEYTFATLLNGRRTIAEAVEELARCAPHHQLDSVSLAELCRWLLASQLALPAERAHAPAANISGQGPAPGPAPGPARLAGRAVWNPLVFQTPLLAPDRLFAELEKRLGWLFSPIASVLGCGLILLAASLLAGRWERFCLSAQGIFAPRSWLWLAGAWLVLKCVHETAHGLVCKRYGGHVRELGILWVVFAPLAYVDVSSSWRFGSRWQRIHVALAGVYAELLVAAAAALSWSAVDGRGWVGHFCFQLVLLAGVTTLAFNANPLMKFDGYYALTDLLRLPNLSALGRDHLRSWFGKTLLSLPRVRRLPLSPVQAGIVAVYAWAALAWRLFVGAGLLIAASQLFQGAGILLAAGALGGWLAPPAAGLVRQFAAGDRRIRRRCLGAAVRLTAAAGLVAAGLALLPWIGTASVPAVVDFAPDVPIRAQTAGFVRQLEVTPGQEVQPGQVLARLENLPLSRELADLELQLQQAELRARQHRQRAELAAEQAERQRQESLAKQRDELRSQVAQLTIRAPQAGRIIGRQLASLPGTYLAAGDPLCAVCAQERKELRLAVAQDQYAAFRQRIGREVVVDVPGYPLWRGELQRLIPRASRQPPHPALLATNGGRLAVQPADEAGGSFELLNPCFTAIVPLSPERARNLRAGQRATVACRPLNQSLGAHLFAQLQQWVRAQ